MGILSWEVHRQPSLRLHSWLISHCPAEAQLLHAQHSRKKTEKHGPSHNIRLLPLLREQHIHTYIHDGIFLNVVLIYEPLKAAAMPHCSQSDRHRRQNNTVTCEVHCKHSARLPTRRKWSIQEKWMYMTRKEMTSHCAGVMDVVSEKRKRCCERLWSLHRITGFLCCFPLSTDLRLMKPPADVFISLHFCFHVSRQTFSVFYKL